ncbi:unnamed protein product [Boreogadus saida]
MYIRRAEAGSCGQDSQLIGWVRREPGPSEGSPTETFVSSVIQREEDEEDGGATGSPLGVVGVSANTEHGVP